MTTNERHTYELTIDADALDNLVDRDPVRDTRHYAALANVDFADIRVAAADSHRFSSADITVRFDATDADVRRYCDYHDCDLDVITRVD